MTPTRPRCGLCPVSAEVAHGLFQALTIRRIGELGGAQHEAQHGALEEPAVDEESDRTAGAARDHQRVHAPKSQNQEMPRIDRYTVRLRRVNWKISQVAVSGFQSIRSSCSAAGARGIPRLAR